MGDRIRRVGSTKLWADVVDGGGSGGVSGTGRDGGGAGLVRGVRRGRGGIADGILRRSCDVQREKLNFE